MAPAFHQSDLIHLAALGRSQHGESVSRLLSALASRTSPITLCRHRADFRLGMSPLPCKYWGWFAFEG
jgi:hypothetical protein